MLDVVCSVPHSGTRSLVTHLDIGANSPRGRWLHFGHDDGRLKQNKDLHLHIPIRNPVSVATSWARRGKNIDGLLAAYHSMFSHLSRPHTAYKMEDLSITEGDDDWDREVHGNGKVAGYVESIMTEVVRPHAEFFSSYYNIT